MEYMAYYHFDKVHDIAQSMRLSLKCCWMNAIKTLDLLFFKLGTDHLFFWWGRGYFFQQLKLDFILDKVKAFFVTIKSPFLTIAFPALYIKNCSQLTETGVSDRALSFTVKLG